MSGTPTTGDVDDGAITSRHVDQLQRLLRWLRHPEYGLSGDPRLDGAAAVAASAAASRTRWRDEIADPFVAAATADDGAAREAARDALVGLLKTIVVRHRKDDLALPKPILVNDEVEVARDPGGDEDASLGRSLGSPPLSRSDRHRSG